MNIGLVILAVYIAVLLGIALYASKKDKKNIKDFATGGGAWHFHSDTDILSNLP